MKCNNNIIITIFHITIDPCMLTGETLNFQCTLRTSEENAIIVIIKWRRGNETVPVQVHLVLSYILFKYFLPVLHCFIIRIRIVLGSVTMMTRRYLSLVIAIPYQERRMEKTKEPSHQPKLILVKRKKVCWIITIFQLTVHTLLYIRTCLLLWLVNTSSRQEVYPFLSVPFVLTTYIAYHTQKKEDIRILGSLCDL